MKWFFSLLLAVSVANSLRAVEPDVLLSGYANVDPGAGPYSLGYSFRTGSEELMVYGLGAVDDGSNTSIDVGLWTAAGAALATTTVPATAKTYGVGSYSSSPAKVVGYKYVEFAIPIPLAANTIYIAAAHASSGAAPSEGSGLTFTHGITLLEQRAEFVTHLAFPNNHGSPTGFYGVNLLFSPLPEQTITFDALPANVFGDAPFAISATASSGLEVTFTSDNIAVADVSGNVVTVKAVGTAHIIAHQSGDSSVNPAPDVSQLLTVGQASQTITFPPLSGSQVGDTLTLAATSSSGLPVSYAITAGTAKLVGAKLSYTAAGVVTVEATQAGNSDYLPAAPVARSVSIGQSGRPGQPVDPGLPAFFVTTPAVTADAATGTAQVTVRRTVVAGAARVHYQTLDHTAIAGVDYTAASGDLSFADGQADATLTIAMKPGATEGRTLTVALSSPNSGLALGSPSTATVTVTTPLTLYRQYALYKLGQCRDFLAEGDVPNEYQAYADYFYFQYLDELDSDPAQATAQLKEYYRNIAVVYWLAYHQQGNEAAALAWYNYILTYAR